MKEDTELSDDRSFLNRIDALCGVANRDRCHWFAEVNGASAGKGDMFRLISVCAQTITVKPSEDFFEARRGIVCGGLEGAACSENRSIVYKHV